MSNEGENKLNGKRKPKPWTRAEERRAEELYKTMSAREVAKQLGRTQQSVEARFFSSKTAPVKAAWKPWTAAEDAYLMPTDNKTAAKHLKRSVAQGVVLA